MHRLGSLQKAVMEAVWELGEASVNQVRDRVSPKRDLAYTTVLTVMQKLERDGWLRHREEGRSYIYAPMRSRRQEGTRALQHFLGQVFGGDPLLLFQHLLDCPELSEKDMAELRKMIAKKGGTR